MWGKSTIELSRLFRALAIGLATLAALVAATASPAAAIDDIVLPIDRITYGSEGDVIQVASVVVDDEFIGVPCIATLIDINNESVHPNNDLIITSGEWTDTILDVESEADSTQVIDEEILLGETVVVEVRLGPDGVSSGGVTLTFGCDDLPELPCGSDADGTPITPNDDGTCPEPTDCGSDADGTPITPNDDGTCPETTGDTPTIDPPCTDADGNPVAPDADGSCPAPPPQGPVDCGNDADGNPVAPDADGSCPTPVEGPPPPLQPSPTPTPTLPVTGVESSLLLGLTGVFILAAGWALVLRPGAPSLASIDDRGASSPRS